MFPKVEHPEEVDLVNGIARPGGGRPRAAGRRHPGRLPHRVRLGCRAAPGDRRSGPRRDWRALIFGLADYSADLGLPAIGNDHLLADWARAEIVAVAGAVGVPAIDGMTLDYPVADPAPRRRRATGRAGWTGCAWCTTTPSVRATSGMLGKWVGHPAQLFAVLLAYEAGLSR